MPLNAQALIAELLSRSLRADAEGFTMTKPLGVTTVSIRADGEPLPGSLHAAPEIEQNAAAVRIVAQEYPELKITYPQTVISECEDSQSGQDPHTVRRYHYDILRTAKNNAISVDFTMSKNQKQTASPLSEK